ncbi:MAG: exo-alpha-sialidase [Sphingomonadales bacterium]|nr:exo-alpha-sialidase [Sphingomonadales bacterium]
MSEQQTGLEAGTIITRRTALVGGSALGALLLPGAAQAAGPALIRRYAAPRQIPNVEHGIIYRRENEFSGWAHVRGYWNFGDGELLQSFGTVPTDYASPAAISHDTQTGLDRSKERLLTVRSKDWGRTWSAPVDAMYRNRARGTENAKALSDLGPIDYLDRDVIVASASPGFGTPDARTIVRISRDRGRTWSPDLPIPLDGLTSLSAINSATVRPDGTVLLFLIDIDKTGAYRHPLVYALPPRGTDFHFLAMVTPLRDPRGDADGDYARELSRPGSMRFGGHRWFYPRGHILPSGRIVCVLRCQRDPMGVMWTELYYSDDGGRTWDFLSRVNDFGSPGSLVVKKDGRLVMVYGYRLMPSGIRATVSEDGGATWGPELIVRDDGGSWDLGYPNAWEMDDGRIGTAYYFNSKNDKVQVNGGVRHICRSIFSVD